jgi:hypothetical protein
MSVDYEHATKPNYAMGADRPDGPITQEVMETLNRAQDQANEVTHRLYQLRDRLFGSPPPSPATANGAKGEAPHFKAAHYERSQRLLETLGEIDRLSNELANRL